MSQEPINNSFFEEEEKPINWKAVIMEYLIYWPFILLFVILCLGGAYTYLRYQAPQYNVNATVLIKQGDKSKNSTAINAISAMQDLGTMSMASNFDNELEILRSRTLIKKVVNNLALNINYYSKGNFSYDKNLYRSTPVKVWMAPDEADRLPSRVNMSIALNPDGKFTATAQYTINGEEQQETKSFDKMPSLMITKVGTISFSTPTDSVKSRIKEPQTLLVTIDNPTGTASECKARLSASAISNSTSIVALNYIDTNVQRGIDFINTLVSLYNSDANDDKNEVASRTAEFINARIEIINSELGTTENELAAYKQKAGITDVTSDAQLAVQGSAEYNNRRAENSTQIRLVEFLSQYINDPANKFEVIPANVGITDATLTTAISQYNEMLIERKRLLRTSNEKNPAVINLDTSIAATRKSVITAVESVHKALLITRSNLDIEARKYESRISNAPIQEKELISISRQQEIKANLYLMLLQKREENAITLAATANNGRIIEEPLFGGQTGPKSKEIYMMAFVLGLAIPIGSIFLIRMLRFKIEGRADVENITNITVIGDIPAVETKDGERTGIVIHENANGIMEEVFRGVRTNVQYMLQEGQKVILVTSTTSGEGKSFIAGNLAVSFAFMGMKTLIMGMDIRKPGLNKVFNISRKQEGITQYLSSPSTTDLMSLCQKSDISDNLYILPGGVVPPNPTELVARKTFDNAMGILKENFDYIIMDTAPIGMVTDTQLISREADMSIYVCRADYTHKSEFELINELRATNKLPNISVAINGIDMTKRRNGYYYGYGKYGKYGKYGYGKKYGYNYGYGYEQNEK
ncbi:MAG: polysaccharide biosynthesis tyrosine autokinase [Phocaeicola sp.]|nr:polysaccharide biosynthesis tyrosine autokinase [Phocaeicola sp.]